MALTIISLIKQVPLPGEMRMGEDGLMDRTKAKSIINIDCQFGLESGSATKETIFRCKINCLLNGSRNRLRPLFGQLFQWDMTKHTFYPTVNLAGAILMLQVWQFSTMLKHLGFTKDSKDPFIILAGRQTSDGRYGSCSVTVAERIGIPQATFVESFKG